MPLGQAAANATAIGAPTSLPDANETLSLLLTMLPTAMQPLPGATTVAPVPSPTPTSSADAANHMRMALTVTHLFLVALGSVNLLVSLSEFCARVKGTYMLCRMLYLYLGDFRDLYEALYEVHHERLHDQPVPSGFHLPSELDSRSCYAAERQELALRLVSLHCLSRDRNYGCVYRAHVLAQICTYLRLSGKYASVIFVVLLAGDRYFAMCKANLCSRYRNYRSATFASLFAWFIAIAAASPLYIYAEVALLRFRNVEVSHKLCIAKWPSSDSARW